MIDRDDRRSQRRFIMVLFSQTVTIEAPCLDADVFHSLKRVAATTDATAVLFATTVHHVS